jgi:hypothetical protein
MPANLGTRPRGDGEGLSTRRRSSPSKSNSPRDPSKERKNRRPTRFGRMIVVRRPALSPRRAVQRPRRAAGGCQPQRSGTPQCPHATTPQSASADDKWLFRARLKVRPGKYHSIEATSTRPRRRHPPQGDQTRRALRRPLCTDPAGPVRVGSGRVGPVRRNASGRRPCVSDGCSGGCREVVDRQDGRWMDVGPFPPSCDRPVPVWTGS